MLIFNISSPVIFAGALTIFTGACPRRPTLVTGWARPRPIGLGSSRIAYWHSTINNKLAHKPIPKPISNHTLTLTLPNHNP